MQIVSVHEIWGGRTGSQDEKGVRTYVRIFRVITDHAMVGQLQVLSAPGLPQRFDPYKDISGDLSQPGGINLNGEVDPYGNIVTDINGEPIQIATANYVDYGALAQQIEARQTENPLVWEVVVTYSNRTDLPDLGDINPLLRPAEIEWSYEPYSKPITSANKIAPLSTNPNDPPAGSIITARVQNSAGDNFDPPVEVDDQRPILTIRRFEATFNPALAQIYKDAINADRFLGAEPFKWKVKGITARRHYENNTFFWEVTYVFHYRAEGWRLSILDQGMRQKAADGKLVAILDKYGQPVTSPVPLNGAGAAVDLNANPNYTGTYLTYLYYPELNYSDLGLGL